MQPMIIAIRHLLYAGPTDLDPQPKDTTRIVVIGENFGDVKQNVDVTAIAKTTQDSDVSFTGNVVRIQNEQMIVDLTAASENSEGSSKNLSKNTCNSLFSLDYLRITVTNKTSEKKDSNSISDVELVS